jgi:hypothetical protein
MATGRRTRIAACLALTVSAASLHAQQSRQKGHSQQFATGTTAITVDVVVRNKHGAPVVDLTKADFELLEDGVRQDVADMTLVAPPGGAEAGADSKRDRSDKPGSHANPGPTTVAAPTFVALVFDRLSPEARNLAYRGAQAYLSTQDENDFAGVFLSDLSLVTIQPYQGGTPLATLPITPDATGRIQELGQLPLASLPPGAYGLELTITGGPAPVTRRAEFTVAPQAGPMAELNFGPTYSGQPNPRTPGTPNRGTPRTENPRTWEPQNREPEIENLGTREPAEPREPSSLLHRCRIERRRIVGRALRHRWRRRLVLLEEQRAQHATEGPENDPDDEHEHEPDHQADNRPCGPVLKAVEHVPHFGRHLVGPFHHPLHHPHLQRAGDEHQGNGDDYVDHGADHAGQQADDRAVPRGDWRLLTLLQQIRGDHPAGDHPKAAAVPDADDREGRQDPHEKAAEDDGLESRGLHTARV